MSTVFVNGRFLTQQLTGVQRYAYEIVSRLPRYIGKPKRSDRLEVYTPKRPPLKIPLPFSTSIGVTRGHVWEQLDLALKVGANNDANLLWSPCSSGPVFTRGYPHILSLHDTFSIDNPEWVSWAFHRWYSVLLPPLVRSTAHVITVSNYSKESIIKSLKIPDDKITVIPEGVPDAFSPPSPQQRDYVIEKYDLPEKFILTLASLEPRKNLDALVKAWSGLPKEYRLPLVIAGGLGSRAVFGKYNLQHLLAQPAIKLLGYVPDEDLPFLYGTSTLFAYVSIEEGFGLPPLEALACGADVVTSNTSAMREYCAPYATLVDPLDTGDIAIGLKDALLNPSSSKEKMERSARVKSRFDWEKATESTFELFSKHV